MSILAQALSGRLWRSCGILWILVVPWGAGSALLGQTSAILDPEHIQFKMLYISEIQVNNRTTLYDHTQSSDPWIELYNPGNEPLSLDAFALSDSYYRFQKYRFPKGWVIFPGQYLIVWMDGEPGQTTRDELHSSLQLSPEGGSLALTTLVKGLPTIVDFADYPRLEADLSFGLIPATQGTTSTQRKVFTRPTPGAANVHLPTVIINEWVIRPPDGPGWIELYNAGRESLDLGGMTISYSIPGQLGPEFTLPRGRKMVPGGFYRLYADDRSALNNTDFLNIHLPWTLPTGTFILELKLGQTLVSQIVTKGTSPTLSESRYPDGGRDIDYVNKATPLAPNVGLTRWLKLPSSQTLRQGGGFSWHAEAVGSAPMIYRWFNAQIPSVPIATGPDFKIASAKPSDAGLYRCVVANEAGNLVAEFRVDVLELPEIIVKSPIELPLQLNEKLVLPTGVGGTGPLRFQWKRNGVNILSANQQDYTKDRISLDDGGSYTAVIRNGAGATLSIPVRVLIDVPQIRVADDFGDRSVIAARGELSGSVRGDNRKATRETGEPIHAGNRGGRSVWFSWKPFKSGIARLHTRGSTFDTLLGVYEGKAVNALKRVESDDDRGGFYTSDLRFNAIAGDEYAIAIDGFGGDTNDFILSWSLEPTSARIPVIARHPTSQTAIPGSTVTFRVTASADVTAYQWYFNDQLIRGATKDTLTLSKVDLSDVGLYSVKVGNESKNIAESYDARLELGNLIRLPSEDKYEPPFQPFSVSKLAGLAQPGQASIPTVSVGAGTIGSQWLTTKGSATQLSEPPPCGSIGGNSRFQVFVMDEPNDIIIDTIGSTYDTILTVYSLGDEPPFHYVTCDSSSSNSLVQFSGQPKTAYYAFVDSADGTTNGITQLNWRVGGLPVLLSPTPPFTNLVNAGSAFSLPIAYSAQPPLTNFQWMLDNEPASGGDVSKLAVFGASPDNAGNYSIILSNVMGSVTGMVANVYVLVPFQLGASKTTGMLGSTDILLKGMAEQGFWVEVSTDLSNWCSFALHSAPSEPFSYTLLTPEKHPQLFFRAQPWPTLPDYILTPCAPGFP